MERKRINWRFIIFRNNISSISFHDIQYRRTAKPCCNPLLRIISASGITITLNRRWIRERLNAADNVGLLEIVNDVIRNSRAKSLAADDRKSRVLLSKTRTRERAFVGRILCLHLHQFLDAPSELLPQQRGTTTAAAAGRPPFFHPSSVPTLPFLLSSLLSPT